MARRESALAYRMMLWQYRLQDWLHLDPPEPHLEKAPIRPGMTVVDYGCGPGRFDIPLAERVGAEGKVYAVDIQPLAIQAVRDRVAAGGVANVEPVLAQGYRTPLPDGCADLVLLLDVFHGIEDRPALLGEIRRLLKDDGRLFMDPGHMPLEEATAAVDATGLFRLLESHGNKMLLAPVTQ